MRKRAPRDALDGARGGELRRGALTEEEAAAAVLDVHDAGRATGAGF